MNVNDHVDADDLVRFPVYADAVALYLDGYNPWPLQPGTSVPVQGVGKDHRTHGGKNHERLTPDEIRSIWRKTKNVPGIGVVLGPGQYVLDLDPKNDPAVVSMFDELRQMTRCDETPHGGLHAHFTDTESVPWARIATKGIDLLASGSFVALPPDRGRRWTGTSRIMSTDNAERYARDFVGRHGYGFEANAANWRTDSDEDVIIPTHARNNTLASLAGLLAKIGIAPNIRRAMLYGAGTDPTAIESPLSDGEIEAIAASMSRRQSRSFNLDDLDIETISSDDEVPALKWRIHHLIPDEAVTLIHGLPAAGKSWIGISLCVACATGRPWDGNEAESIKSRVLYLDWERRGSMVKRRLIAYGKRYGVTIDYVAMKGALRSRIEWLRQIIAARNYGFVLVDSLTISMMGADVNNQNEVVPAMFDLQDVCDDFKIAIVVLDHQRRTAPGTRGDTEGAFGSIFKEAVATMQWQALRTSDKFTENYMDLKLRLHKKNHEAMISDVGLRLTFEFGPAGEVTNAYLLPRREETPEDKIMEVLDGDTCDLNSLCARIGIKASEMKKILDGMIADNRVYIADAIGNRATYALVMNKTGES